MLPLYHMVSDVSSPIVNKLYSYPNITKFKNDICFFSSNYSTISMDEILNSINNNEKIRKKVFLLCFDDGFKENFTIIRPILLQKKLPAAFFLCPDNLDNKSMMYRNKISLLLNELERRPILQKDKEVIVQLKMEGIFVENIEKSLKNIYMDSPVIDMIAKQWGIDFQRYLKNKRPYLQIKQVKQLISDGFYIGAHSNSHPLFSKLSLAEQIKETEKSINHITDLFDLDYKLFSFPFNDIGVSKIYFKAIYDKNYVDLFFGSMGLKNDEINNIIHRYCFEGTNSNIQAKEVVYSLYMKSLIKQLIKKNNVDRAHGN